MSSATTHPAVTPSEKYYKIVTSDEKVFNVPECKINRMTTIRNMIDDVGDDTEEVIPIPVSSNTFTKILEFEAIDESIITHANNNEVIEKMRKEPLSDEVIKIFESYNFNDIFEFIRATNYIDYKVALNSICKYTSEMIKVLPANEIQSVFEANITDEENTEFKETHPDILMDDAPTSGGAPAPPKHGEGVVHKDDE